MKDSKTSTKLNNDEEWTLTNPDGVDTQLNEEQNEENKDSLVGCNSIIEEQISAFSNSLFGMMEYVSSQLPDRKTVTENYEEARKMFQEVAYGTIEEETTNVGEVVTTKEQSHTTDNSKKLKS